MTQYTIREVQRIGRERAFRQSVTSRDILRHASEQPGRFDIFLSHSFADADLILGVRELLQRSGKTAYVDWIDDPQLDRSRVTAASARTLRERMRQCASLVYAATKAATMSKWMPWELGYFDGRKGAEAIAIMPIVEYDGQRLGQEYLDMYSQIEKPDWSSLSAPIVTKRLGPVVMQKSLSELVAARGGSAWSVQDSRSKR